MRLNTEQQQISRLPIMLRNLRIVVLVLAIVVGLSGTTSLQAQERSTLVNSLQVLYDFRGSRGNDILDRSGKLPPLDLHIDDMNQVSLGDGVLSIRGAAGIASKRSAKRLVKAIQRSGSITVEVWLRTQGLQQEGPARIVTLSKNSVQRNFTLGQEKTEFQARLRTSRTSSNGIPAVSSTTRSLNQRLMHVVYTRGRSGNVRVYINGRLNHEQKVAGDFGPWDEQYRLALGDELTGDRPWLGDLYLVAIYNRELVPDEVAGRFSQGAGTGATELMNAVADSRPDFFETRIAPVLSQHCLECHDAASRKGGLDLSHKELALQGGDSGKVILPGQAAESLLWKAVWNDQMPHERPPLKAAEKDALKQWIDEGAVWSLDYVDPAIYRHEREAGHWVQRLTIPEYVASIESVFKVNVAQEATQILPQDKRADGFRNTAYNLNVDLKHIEAYARLAALVVERLDVEPFARRFSKSQKLTDDHMRQLIADMGKWVLRGPLTEQEIVLYRGVSTTVASAGGDFREAVGMVLEAMLQSPRFLYRMENQLGDGTRWPVDDYELASRVSFIVWGAPPDEELLALAESGQLSDPEQLRQQVGRLLADPKARAQSKQFIVQWLNLGRLRSMNPDTARFPRWEASLADDMRQETIDFFMDLVWEQKKPLSDLLNAQFTYLTPQLAEHYGIPSKGTGWQRYDLNAIESRGGLLTQGSVLTMGGDDASMVTRGLFVLNDLLFSEVGDPPPGLDTTPVPTSPGTTHRAIATERIQSESCGGCHARFEPLAFGLEIFNGLGTFQRVDEHGNKLRQDGQILFPGEAVPAPYRNSAEMMDLLAGNERVKQCLTRKVSQFALGRPLDASDAPSLRRIYQASQKQGGTYQSLVAAIVLSDLVRSTMTEPESAK